MKALCVAGLLSSLLVCAEPARAQTGSQIATVTAEPSSRIVPPSNSYVFPSEKYVYSVQWRFFSAGTSSVQIQRTSSGERVTATADSAGFPDKIFRVHDIFNADLDARSYCTLHISKHSEEGPRRRELDEALNYSRLKSVVNLKDLKSSETKHAEFDIPPCVTDVISGFFYVASLPLAPGYSQTFPVNDNGKTTNVMIKVEGHDHVKGPMGEFDTLRVGAQPLSGPMTGKGVLWVWFTEDARRIPVQMKSKLGFATLLFQLQRVESTEGN
jgi:uncharacterized protein DUF3108